MAGTEVRVLLTGGGTGGHIYPAIVIADEIRRLNPAAKFLFVGTRRGLESKVVPPLGYPIEYVDVRYFIRSLTLKNFAVAYKALTSVQAAKKIIRKFQPEVVIGTGGYVSGPVVLAATRLKVPTLIHEQNAFPGLTTRLLSRRVNRVAVSHAAAVKRMKSGTAVVVTGHPVRREFYEKEGQDFRQQAGISQEQKIVILVGGSGGALKLNQVALAAAPAILTDPNLVFIHVTGGRYYDWARGELEKSPLAPHLAGRYRLMEYLHEMPGAMKACDLMVARAGGMVHELTVTGCPSLLVPSPNVAENHQFYNAKAMAEAGAAIMLKESELSAEKLTEEIHSLLREPGRLKNMAIAALSLGKPEAGRRLAKIALQMVKNSF